MLWKRKFSDDDIVQAIRSGGYDAEKAIAFLYSEYRGLVTQFIISKNGTKNEALDVFQDSIVQLVSGIELGKFKGNSSLKTYLFAISKRLWYRRFNKTTRHRDYIRENPFSDVADSNPEAILVQKDKVLKIDALMKCLSPKSREVLLLWIQNYSMKEIADKMGFKNEQVARNKKSHSLKELKELIEKQQQVSSILEELK